MIYSRAVATSGSPCLHSQKLSGEAFIQLNGVSYSLSTHWPGSRQMLGYIYSKSCRRSFTESDHGGGFHKKKKKLLL